MVTNFVSGLNLVRLNLWNILLSNVLNREYLHLQIRLLDSKLIEWKEEKKQSELGNLVCFSLLLAHLKSSSYFLLLFGRLKTKAEKRHVEKCRNLKKTMKTVQAKMPFFACFNSLKFSLSLSLLSLFLFEFSLSLAVSVPTHKHTDKDYLYICITLPRYVSKKVILHFFSLSLCHCHTLQQHQSFFCFCK